MNEGTCAVCSGCGRRKLRGGTPTMAVRSKEFAPLCRKITALKTSASDGEATS